MAKTKTWVEPLNDGTLEITIGEDSPRSLVVVRTWADGDSARILGHGGLWFNRSRARACGDRITSEDFGIPIETLEKVRSLWEEHIQPPPPPPPRPSWQPKPSKPQLTYILANEANSLVKIGKGQTPHSRIRGIQAMSPVMLETLCILSIPERALHDLFREQRIRSEWFNRSPGIDILIEYGIEQGLNATMEGLLKRLHPSPASPSSSGTRSAA